MFGGSIVQSGEGYGLAIKTGDDTVMGQIANLSSSSKSKPSSPLSREIRRFCKLITFLASATAVVFFIIAWAGGRSFNYAMQFGIGILIAWVPQGLPLTVTMLLAIAGQRMSKRQVLVKDLYGVETLGAITLLCSDKTGTLTCNQMNVTNVWTNRIMYYAGQNPEDAPKSERLLRMDTSGVAQILHIAATCTRARFETSSESTSNYNDHNHPHEKRTTSLSSSWTPPPSVSSSSGPSSNIIGDPTDAGLLRWAATRLKNIEKLPSLYPKIFEIPFTSDTKCHITIHRKSHREGGLTLHVKGAPEIIFDLCSTIMLDGQAIPCSDQQQQYRKSFMEAYNTMANRGHRVLALAQYALPGTKFPDNFNFSIERRNWPTSGYTFLGLVSLEDPPKVGVADSIAKMKQAGIKVFMITGDHALTAEAVARRVNIVTGLTRDQAAKKYNKSIEAVLPDEYSTVIIEGKRLEHLSQEDWDEMLSKEEVIFARTSPRQKLEIVTMAQSMGHIVGVTGDGVNDAAALRKADLGIGNVRREFRMASH